MKLKMVKSPILLESQVEIIFLRLKEAPKLYETDGQEVKKVVVKLFHPLFTLYVVEYDTHSNRAFGYMKNEQDNELSEWGYSLVEELIELGFEMDIYFVNKSIRFDGSLIDSEEVLNG